MESQHIFERNKSRLMDWVRRHPTGVRCSICGATGPVLALGNIDVMHTSFVARCTPHLRSSPKLLSVYATVFEQRQKPADVDDAQWFSANPQRTHRLRPTFPDERVQYPRSGSLMLVRRCEPGGTDRISIAVSDPEKLEDDDDLLRHMFDQARKAGRGGAIWLNLSPSDVAEGK